MSALTRPARCTAGSGSDGAGIFARLSQMTALHHQRRQLRRMDDAQLSDVGLTRVQADAEAHRPVWDVPANWRS